MPRLNSIHKLAALPTEKAKRDATMFEPVHGSAFEGVGKGIASPMEVFWTAVELLRWLSAADAADALMESLETVIERGCRTADPGGNSRTEDVTNEVCREIEGSQGLEDRDSR